MLIGQEEYPIEESVLFLVLLVVLVLDVFLFNRGHGSYTVKYQLMRKHKFFRVNQLATFWVDVCYKLFFALPFILIAVITILRATKNVVSFPPILVNTMIVVLIIYPIHREYYYFRYGVIWVLALASQLFTQFLQENYTQQSSFVQISFIFYTLNSIVFCLALLYKQQVYWELAEGLKSLDPNEVKKVNESWLDDTKEKSLPKIFYGGIYGHMNRTYQFSVFIGLYMLSLLILGVYAFVIYITSQSYLGVTGLITSFVYDVFILIFSTLKENQRSIKSIFYMVFIGRLLSFVFGELYWLFGYCIMYFLVGIFIGALVIDNLFPLKIEVKNKDMKRQKVNALKTPEFVLLVLTVEIIVLIIVEQFTSVSDVAMIFYNQRQIPVWQFAILIVIATWVIIFYLLCGRLLSRHIQRIHSLVEYYFGFANFTQYHIYMILTYLLIIAGGLYSLLYLNDKNIFLGCVFLPFIYLLVFEIGAAWVRNDYAILADTEEYNKREIKRLEIKEAKEKMIQNRVNEQRAKKISKLKASNIEEETKTNFNQGLTQNDAFRHSQNRLLPVYEVSNKRQTTPQGYQYSSESAQQQTDINIYINHQMDSEKETSKECVVNFQPLLNWRKNKQLTYSQIWGNLTKHDKTILVFSLVTILVFIIYVIVSYTWAESIGGLAFSLSIISIITTFVYYKVNMTGQTYNVGEIIVGIAGFVMAVVFWGVEYEITYGGIIWSVVSILLYFLSLTTGLDKNMDLFIVVILCAKIILLLCFICLLLGLQYGVGVGVVSIAVVLCCLMGAINMYYLRKKSHLPKLVKYGTGLVIVCIVVALAVTGFVLDFLSDFSVFTILMAIIVVAILIIYGLIYLDKAFNEWIHPHVYSAYGLTIYRFQSDNEKLKSSTNHVVVFNISMILLVVYSAITTLFFREKYMAIYSLSIFMIFQFTQLTFRSIDTYYYMGNNRQQITQKILRDTFKTVMEKYMPDETEGEDSPFFIKKFKEMKQLALKAETYEDKDRLWKQTVELKQEVFKNLQEEEKFLFFWLALIKFTIYSQKLSKMNDFLIIVQELKPQLEELGIVIEGIESTEGTQIKYKLVQKEIGSLMPFDAVLVEELIAVRVEEKKRKLKQEEKLHLMNEQAHRQKLQELYKMQSEQIKVPIKQTVKKAKSKIQQYQEMLNSLSKDQLFEDKQFPHDYSVIGEKLQSVVAVWRRPKFGEKFVANGMSPDDVKQGKIGDCYLISSFAVLGQKFLKQAIGESYSQTDSKAISQWKNQKGAYMIRFHKFSRQVFIVVDDYLPVDVNNNWVFATSEDTLQFWPGILEKAYAKLYGGYQNIISGKCHQVLAQFTGGFPFQILVKQYKANINALWNRMVQAKNNGYLLAAGSPSNERGDAVASQRGIVQGHAYSILDVRVLQKYKLIKLKNPHGSAGKQWNGPFSDESRYMTQKMRQQLKHEKKNDGIFWMQLQDFIAEFKSLYICCIFEKDWKKHEPITGQWKKNVNSFGRPQKSNKSHKNYQIGITVQKKCTFFISLSQKQTSALYGENFIYLRVQRNEGKRLRKNDVSSDELCGPATKPTNLATISQQIELQSSQYPYTFTVYVSAQREVDGGVEPGDGEFQLQLFCNDLESAVIRHEQFDKLGLQEKDD